MTKYVSFQAVLDHRKAGVRSLKNDEKCRIGRFPVCISSHVGLSIHLCDSSMSKARSQTLRTKPSTILHRKGMNEYHGPQVITPLFYIWMFPKIGGKTPKWMVKIMENLIKMDDLGVPLIWRHPYVHRRWNLKITHNKREKHGKTSSKIP